MQQGKAKAFLRVSCVFMENKKFVLDPYLRRFLAEHVARTRKRDLSIQAGFLAEEDIRAILYLIRAETDKKTLPARIIPTETKKVRRRKAVAV